MCFIIAHAGVCRISIHPYPRELNGAYFRVISDVQTDDVFQQKYIIIRRLAATCGFNYGFELIILF